MPIKFYKVLKTLKGQAPSGNTDTNYELVGETITEDEKNSINSKIEAAKNYNFLSNRPSINNVVLEGNKTLAELGINIVQTVTNSASQIPSAAAVYNFVGSSGASAIQTGVEFNTGKTLDGKPIYGMYYLISWVPELSPSQKNLAYTLTFSSKLPGYKIIHSMPLIQRNATCITNWILDRGNYKAKIEVMVNDGNLSFYLSVLSGMITAPGNFPMKIGYLAYYTK